MPLYWLNINYSFLIILTEAEMKLHCGIWVSNSCGDEEFYLLEYDALYAVVSHNTELWN
jgi:hypothetical protein